MGLNSKEITKKDDGRRDSKESFTQMNKDGNMKDGIGAKMIQLETVKYSKPRRKGEAGRPRPFLMKGANRTI